MGHFGGNVRGAGSPWIALILNFQFSALNYFIKRLGGNKKGVPLRSGKQNGLNQSFPIIELCA